MLDSDLNYQDLVNWSHPLNRGRVAWWPVLPQWRGGVTVRDIARRKHGAWNVGGSDSIPSKWIGPRGRPGSWGALLFDGVDDYVSVGNFGSLTSATFRCWVRRDTSWVAGTGVIFSRGGGGSVTGLNSDVSTGNNLGYTWNDASNTWGWNSGLGIPLGRWVYVAVSINPSSATAYLFDGGVLSTAVNSVSHTSTSLAALDLGRDSFSDRRINGLLDDLAIWNRPLSENEVREDYSQSRRGYPDLLNRYRPVAYSVPAGAPPAGLPFRPLRSGVLRSRLIRRAG